MTGFAGLELFRLDGRVALITGGGSEAASFVTGHILAVDGGYVAQ